MEYPLAKGLLDEINRLKSNRDSEESIERRAQSYLRDNSMYPKTAKDIAVISAGGGVGKTTTAINLALNLRKRTSGKVLFIEEDIPNPNAEIYLSPIMVKFPETRGRLSQILQHPHGELKKGELGRRDANGTLMELIDSKMGATTDPKIFTFFSDLTNNANVEKVYKQLLTTLKRVSAYQPQNEDGGRLDYIVHDSRAGSMSDPVVTRLMHYFDYRVLILIPDAKEVQGIRNALRNDSQGEYTRSDAFNILVFNKVPPGFLEEYAPISDAKGKATYEAEGLVGGIKENLSGMLKVDGYVTIVYNKHVNNQGRSPNQVLIPAIANRKRLLNDSYCLKIDELTDMIVNDNLKKAQGEK